MRPAITIRTCARCGHVLVRWETGWRCGDKECK